MCCWIFLFFIIDRGFYKLLDLHEMRVKMQNNRENIPIHAPPVTSGLPPERTQQRTSALQLTQIPSYFMMKEVGQSH